MANLAVGYNSYLGIGKESTWGTAVSPTTFVEFLDANIKKNITPIESGALVGSRFKRSIDVNGTVDVSGDFSLEVNPDNIGLLLAATLGAEADPAQVGTTSAYDHEFTPADDLIPLTIEVYKDTLATSADKAQRFSGCEINTFGITCDLNAYLKATFGIIGKDMAEEDKTTPTYSTKQGFVFSQGAMKIDGTSVDYIKTFEFNINNNLFGDRYTLNGSKLRTGVQPQTSDITGKIDIESTQAAYAAEVAKYLANTDTALELTFTSDEEIETGYYYTLTISVPHVKYKGSDDAISGKDIIPLSLDWEAWYNGSDDIITITLRDGRSTKWSA